jgi:integrase
MVQATAAAGLTGFHFHDLRHTGNTLAGEEGASLRELVERMGHCAFSSGADDGNRTRTVSLGTGLSCTL